MLKFGFIGCGKISRFHADVILALQHGILAVSARSGSKNISDFAKCYSISNLYYDWREMVEKQKLDALVVAVNWDQTEHIIQEVINYGIPCLVEKPVALTSDRLQEIINNTKQFHDIVMVGYNRRFYDFLPMIKQALERENLISVELNFPEPVEYLLKTKSQQLAKHILLYMSSHWIDLLMFLIGELKVEYMNRRINKKLGYVEAYNGILRSIHYGVPIHLQANFNAPSNISIVFNFSDSIYKFCPIEILNIYRGMEVVEPTIEIPIRRYIPHLEKTFYVDTMYKPGFLNQMKYFIKVCLEKKEPNKQGCTLREALAVTRICEEIGQAS